MTYKMLGAVQSLPSPVGGWNVRDSIANMDPKDAVTMQNWWPMPSDVMVRKGWTTQCTGFAGQAETVMAYNGPSIKKLFGVASGVIFDASTASAVTATSGFSNSRFQHDNFTNPAGSVYLVACNGTDSIQMFDSTAWSQPTISGFTASNAINVNVFKGRLWFVEKGTLNAWYLNTGAIQGTAAKVDLSGFTTRGGTLMSMGTWTLDAGSGVDDYAVFVTDQGEVLVFQGTDPTQSSTWAMKGRWQLGSPLGRRCLKRLGGDLLLICVDGVVPLSKALISSRVQPKVALTDKIQGAMSDAASAYQNNFGWDLLFCPKNSQLILNVPVGTNLQQQYAMNTITGSWGNFQNIAANCWELWGDDAYFGANTRIGKFWSATSDKDGTVNIQAEALQAFSYFGTRGRVKHFKEARPIFATDGTPSIKALLEVNYGMNQSSGPLNFTSNPAGKWDSAVWDASVWGGGLTIQNNWQTLGAVGTSAAIHLFSASLDIEVHWEATDFLYELGGVIG